jgi:hypothetical protein
MKKIDEHFDEKFVPNIAVGIFPYLDEKMLNKVIATNLEHKSFHATDKFHTIYQEFRKLFDFQIKINESFVDYDEISNLIIEIFSMDSKIVEILIHEILEKNIRSKNESIIGNL